MYKRRSRKSSRRSKRSSKLPYTTKVVDFKQNKVIKNLQKSVKGMKKDEETKCWIVYDNFAYGTSYSTTLTQTNPVKLVLNAAQRGTLNYNRIGDKIKCTSLRIVGTIYPSAAPGIGIDALVRIMVVRFKAPQGRDLQISGDTMSATNGPPLFFATAGNPVWPQMTFNNGNSGQGNVMQHYDIVYDKKFKLDNKVGTTYYNAGAVNQCVNPSVNFMIRRKLGFITDLGLGNAGTYADFTKNSLYLIITTETNTNLTVKFNTHVYFKDF